MGKYIKTFDTHDEYETYIGGGDAMLPNVSYCKNINDVHYNPFLLGINTYISCVDIANGTEVEGATIQVIDSEGNMVEEWTSTTEPHTIEGLKTGETYKLRTTIVPDEYLPTTETTFSIDETGRVTGTGTMAEDNILLVELRHK